METDEVIPARNNRENQSVAKNMPKGIFSNIMGMVTNPRLKEPDLAISDMATGPKKAKAQGMTSDPPKIV
jgi:hypothetical protein